MNSYLLDPSHEMSEAEYMGYTQLDEDWSDEEPEDILDLYERYPDWGWPESGTRS